MEREEIHTQDAARDVGEAAPKDRKIPRGFAGTYDIGDRQRDDLAKRFAHHPPAGTQLERYARVRIGCRELAEDITMLTPPGREQAVALTNLEQVMFWANAAIARGEQP